MLPFFELDKAEAKESVDTGGANLIAVATGIDFQAPELVAGDADHVFAEGGVELRRRDGRDAGNGVLQVLEPARGEGKDARGPSAIRLRSLLELEVVAFNGPIASPVKAKANPGPAAIIGIDV